MFAAFAKNTVLIHEEFKKFVAMETKNTSSIIELQKQVENILKNWIAFLDWDLLF